MAADPHQLAQWTEAIRGLAPWHQNIPLTADFSTGQAFSPDGKLGRRENQNVELLPNLGEHFQRWIDRLYGGSLAGKRFLDCACNAGIYCFVARENGAEFSFGFDIRDHWIRQAQWVQDHRQIAPTDRIKFAVCDLYALPERALPEFDIAMFKGIFYHLPDPIRALQIVSERTKELLIFNTQTSWGDPDGFLRPGSEDVRSLMSGAYGLNWRPTGPQTMVPVLAWLGYCEAKVVFFRQNPANPNLGRMEILAAKTPGLLEGLTEFPDLWRRTT